jgi:hypothetical protein
MISLVQGYNLVSSVAPISGDLVTNLGYSPSVGDSVLLWSSASQSYTPYGYVSSKGVLKWTPGSPQIAVGQSFFIQAAAAKTWTNTFISN